MVPPSLGILEFSRFGRRSNCPDYQCTIFYRHQARSLPRPGKGDIQASHDIEDIITLIDGSSTIVEQVDAAPDDARHYISRELVAWQKTDSFIDELAGHLSPISQASGRTSIVIDRITSIAQLAT